MALRSVHNGLACGGRAELCRDRERAKQVHAGRQVAEALADVEHRRIHAGHPGQRAGAGVAPTDGESDRAHEFVLGDAEELVFGLGVERQPAVPAGVLPGRAVADRQCKIGKDRLGPVEGRVELLRVAGIMRQPGQVGSDNSSVTPGSSMASVAGKIRSLQTEWGQAGVTHNAAAPATRPQRSDGRGGHERRTSNLRERRPCAPRGA